MDVAVLTSALAVGALAAGCHRHAAAQRGAHTSHPGHKQGTPSRRAVGVARRATFDLGCEVTPAQVTHLGAFQYGIEACGCRASYIIMQHSSNHRYDMPPHLDVVSGENCQVRTGGSAGGAQ